MRKIFFNCVCYGLFINIFFVYAVQSAWAETPVENPFPTTTGSDTEESSLGNLLESAPEFWKLLKQETEQLHAALQENLETLPAKTEQLQQKYYWVYESAQQGLEKAYQFAKESGKVEEFFNQQILWLEESTGNFDSQQLKKELSLIYIKHATLHNSLNKVLALAKEGNIDAQALVADYYFQLEVYKEAEAWAVKAAKQNNSKAQQLLKELYSGKYPGYSLCGTSLLQKEGKP